MQEDAIVAICDRRMAKLVMRRATAIVPMAKRSDFEATADHSVPTRVAEQVAVNGV